MKHDTLDDWFLEQELRRLRRDWCITGPGGHHDIDDEMLDTRGYSYILLEDIADPHSRTPFEAVEFVGAVSEDGVHGLLSEEEADTVTINGREVPLDEIVEALEAIEERQSDLYNCCPACDADYEQFRYEMEEDVVDEAKGVLERHGKRLPPDFGPTRIASRKFAKTKLYELHFKSSSRIERRGRAKTSSLKQDHRHRPEVVRGLQASRL